MSSNNPLAYNIGDIRYGDVVIFFQSIFRREISFSLTLHKLIYWIIVFLFDCLFNYLDLYCRNMFRYYRYYNTMY